MRIHDVRVVPSTGAVGLYRPPQGPLQLQVPIGMEGVPAGAALAVLYKSFVVFKRTRRAAARLAALDGVETEHGSGLPLATGDFAFFDAFALDALFDRADPTRVLALRERRARRQASSSEGLHRQLHLAVFDTEGTPYVERPVGVRNEAHYAADDLVGLYCFVAYDFYERFLEVDIVYPWGRFAAEGVALAAEFRHRHLFADATLYDADVAACARTRQALQDVLRAIDRKTRFRTTDYRALYDALDRYLNGGVHAQGEAGLIWGVNNFWAVWESACLAYAATAGEADVVTCDFEHLPPELFDAAREQEWLQQRERFFARNEIKRRPDLVVATTHDMRIVDFKYYAELAALRPQSTAQDLSKLERDFINIELYGLLLQNTLLKTAEPRANAIALEIWIPGIDHRRISPSRQPRWDPPLTIVTQRAVDVLQAYSALYRARPTSVVH
ncbi:hypothetical protein E4K72_05980 [Oxalobacteraceae bacterium OM1]|nr:hypothetical protein E4K72_05980 [Oxalobacteraceae bacterium OM1]